MPSNTGRRINGLCAFWVYALITHPIQVLRYVLSIALAIIIITIDAMIAFSLATGEHLWEGYTALIITTLVTSLTLAVYYLAAIVTWCRSVSMRVR